MSVPTNVVSPIAPGPGVRAVAVVPSDTVALASPTSKVYVGGAGALTVIMNGDTAAVTFAAVAAGAMLDISVTKVMATGTNATLILALS
jgi:hypothetical protein